jgi:hypothetical protein
VTDLFDDRVHGVLNSLLLGDVDTESDALNLALFAFEVLDFQASEVSWSPASISITLLAYQTIR